MVCLCGVCENVVIWGYDIRLYAFSVYFGKWWRGAFPTDATTLEREDWTD